MPPALREEHIEGTWLSEDDLPLVWADGTILMQVFLNLTSNSRRALSRQRDRELSVAARLENRRVIVEIVDNGGGVKHPELLFHPFQDDAHETGLGLYLSRAFVRSFGGELRHKAVPRWGVLHSRIAARRYIRGNSMKSPIRLLLVDDHSLFRESLVRLLEAEQDLTIAAQCESVPKAREILANTTVDVVLLDYDLGDEIGTELLRGRDLRKSNFKILMVTAGMRDDVTLTVLNSGVAGVIFKQSGPGHLIEAIRKVASGDIWLDTNVMRSLISGAREKPQTAESVQVLEQAAGAASPSQSPGWISEQRVASRHNLQFPRRRSRRPSKNCSTRLGSGVSAN